MRISPYVAIKTRSFQLKKEDMQKTIGRLHFRLSGPNLDLLCVRQSDAPPFCENYVKLCFDAKHIEEGLKGGEIFGALFGHCRMLP